MRLLPLLLLCFAYTSLAIQNQSAFVVKERINTPSNRSWSNVGVPSPTQILNLRIALPQSNFSALEDLLYRVSSPDSPQYGQFLTKTQVEHFVQPHQESVSAVEDWLVGHGINVNDTVQRSPAGDWLKLPVTVALAEQMMATKYYVWEHSDGTRLIRTTQYSLPEELHPHIDFVQPTTVFSRGPRRRSFSPSSNISSPVVPRQSPSSLPPINTIDEGCRTRITMSCLKQIYNITDDATNVNSTNRIGVAGFLNQFANIADLKTFYSRQLPQAVGSTFQTILVNGGTNSQVPSMASPEVDLDVEYAFGMSFPTPGVFYSVGGLAPFLSDANEPEDTNEPYLDWVEFLLASSEIPQTISVSYGDDEQTVPFTYALRVCQLFAQLGARGVSLLFGSGDAGVAGSDPSREECISNTGTNATKFIPNFPASCPYVTAVGATEGFNPEVGTTSFPSGGGFSDYFPAPPFTQAAVEVFFEQSPNLPPAYHGFFQPNGTPIPDVSAQGDHYQIIWQGAQVDISGASTSTPTFASIIAMINGARLNSGKSPLGWLNPMLYTVGFHGLNDIVEGSNPGCGEPGFNATVGWDPVTGLGTPNFPKLKEILLDLP